MVRKFESFEAVIFLEAVQKFRLLLQFVQLKTFSRNYTKNIVCHKYNIDKSVGAQFMPFTVSIATVAFRASRINLE